jgi:hypothetical protein
MQAVAMLEQARTYNVTSHELTDQDKPSPPCHSINTIADGQKDSTPASLMPVSDIKEDPSSDVYVCENVMKLCLGHSLTIICIFYIKDLLHRNSVFFFCKGNGTHKGFYKQQLLAYNILIIVTFPEARKVSPAT